MYRLFFVSLLLSWTQVAFGFEGFVKLKTGRQVFAKYETTKKARPTVVLVNGLTNDVTHWNLFVSALSKYEFNILRFDMYGQGQTLDKYGPFREPISYLSQVEDMQALLEHFNIKNATTFGLSYGGAIVAAHAVRFPTYVERVIPVAPYTEALRSQDAYIRLQIATTRLMFPFNPASDDELYDFFLRQIVYSTYPFAEPSVMSHPYKLDATFRMTQGIRKLVLGSQMAQLKVPMHLVTAQYDQYLDSQSLEDFWMLVPKKYKISRGNIGGSEHKIPESQPVAAAAWLNAIIEGDDLISNGRVFEIDERSLIATSYDGHIFLK